MSERGQLGRSEHVVPVRIVPSPSDRTGVEQLRCPRARARRSAEIARELNGLQRMTTLGDGRSVWRRHTVRAIDQLDISWPSEEVYRTTKRRPESISEANHRPRAWHRNCSIRPRAGVADLIFVSESQTTGNCNFDRAPRRSGAVLRNTGTFAVDNTKMTAIEAEL